MSNSNKGEDSSLFSRHRSRRKEALASRRMVPNESRAAGARALGLAFGLLAVAAAVLMGTLLLWRPAVASAEASTEDGLQWLQGTAPFSLLATATPTPVPAPTLTPGDVAVQFVPPLRIALSVRNWDRALELVAIMSAIDPAGEQVRQWAYTTALQYGQALVDSGQVEDAQNQFDRAVSLVPDHEEADLWQQTTQLYRTGRDAAASGQWEVSLQNFELAEEQIPDYDDLFSRLSEAFRGQGEAAIGSEDWPLAIESLTQLHERLPSDPNAPDLLSQAYRGKAQAAMAAGKWAAAIDTMLEARERLPDDQKVIELLSLAYRDQGQAATVQQDWTAAIETLARAHEQLPGDKDVSALLASAYRQRGIALQERATRNTKRLDMVKLREARADLNEALVLRSGDSEARAYLVQVEKLLFPPKRIEVDISKQRLYAWQGDSLVYKFPVSTGLRGQDTATGRFQILDKIPMAYSRIWRLKMPNWMGIYYVQGIENGFHGLPYRPDGSKMWAGLLGRRASYGCIVLGTKPAKTLYDWAEIGTRVDIHK